MNWQDIIAEIEADATSPEAIKAAITVLTGLQNTIEAATPNPLAVRAEDLFFQLAITKLTAMLPANSDPMVNPDPTTSGTTSAP